MSSSVRVPESGWRVEFLIFPRRTRAHTAEVRSVARADGFLTTASSGNSPLASKVESWYLAPLARLVTQCQLMELDVPVGRSGVESALDLLVGAMGRL